MAEKEFTLRVTRVTAQRRSKRSVAVYEGTQSDNILPDSDSSGIDSNGEWHTHDNKEALDKLNVTDDGYIEITDMRGEETTTEKAKAGYADTAKEAEHASTADLADEAKTLTEDSEIWEMFLSRLKDDTAEGNLTFKKTLTVLGLAALRSGLKVGNGEMGIDSEGNATLNELTASLATLVKAEIEQLKVTKGADIMLERMQSSGYQPGIAGKGVAIEETSNGAYRISIDELLVRKIATFLKLEIRELSYVGGNLVLSKAGNKISKVETVTGGWKCYFTANEGDEVQNYWKVGDQARCQSFDVYEGTQTGVQSKYYWRLVTEVGNEYVVLSESDYDKSVTNSVPESGDTIVQMGYRMSGDEENKDRTSLIMLLTVGENSPSIEAYTGITDYTLGAERRLFILSPGEVSFRSDLFRWMSGGVAFPQEIYKGDWQSGEHYDYYNKVTWNGSTWICIATDGTTEEPSAESTAWKVNAAQGAPGKDGASYSPNLIVGTKEMKDWSWAGTNNVSRELINDSDGSTYLKQTMTAEPGGNVQNYIWLKYGDLAERNHMDKLPYEIFIPGKKYTLSFEYKSDSVIAVTLDARGSGVSNKTIIPNTVFQQSAQWQRVYVTGTCPGGVDNEAYIWCILSAYMGSSQTSNDVSVGDTAYFRNFCLVEGEGTQWIPAASEMEGQPGKDGKDVFNAVIAPSVISFTTNENGTVIYKDNTAKVTATYGNIPAKVSIVEGSTVLTGLTGFGQTGSGTEEMTIAMTAVKNSTVNVELPDGSTKEMTLPATSGSATFKVKLQYASYTEERTLSVPFTVDVNASFADIVKTTNSITQTVGELKTENGTLSESISQVQQTAESITQTVKASIRTGRNLLSGSYWRAVVLTETRHMYAILRNGGEYTLSARGRCSGNITNAGMYMIVTVFAVQADGTWGNNYAVTFNTNAFEEKSITFTLKNGNGIVYDSYINVHVYAAIVKSAESGPVTEEELPGGAAGYVEWIQLEEGGVATPWSANESDNVVRPNIIEGFEEYSNVGESPEGYSEEVETALPDGTTGTVRHAVADYNAEATSHLTYLFGTYMKAEIKPNSTYTISFWAKAGTTNTARISVYPLPYDDYTGYMDNVGGINGAKQAYQMYKEDKIFPAKEWKRYEVTYTTKNVLTRNTLTMFANASTDTNYPHADIYFYGWKIEEGSPSTDNSMQSLIKQTASNIDIVIENLNTGLETAGVHIDGENSKITLKAATTEIEGDEFNANNATFKNIKVEGVLSSVVAETGYDNRNYFVGDKNMPTEAMNILIRADLPDSTGKEQHIFLPSDYDFIGSHVMIFADNVVDNTGRVEKKDGLFRKAIIRAGRNYMRHAYITFGTGGGSGAYRIGQNVYTVDSIEGAGQNLRNIFQNALKSASYFGRWLLETSSDGSFQAPNEIQISNGYIEFVGIPAPSANVKLYPFAVALQTDDTETQTDDNNSHLLKYETVTSGSSLRPYFEVEFEEDGVTPVLDPLQKKLEDLYSAGGEDALPSGVTSTGFGSVVYFNKTHEIATITRRIFTTPLCRWYPVNICVPDETDINYLKVAYTNPEENLGIRIVDGNMIL